ncbi:MAG: hypothetical protein CML56_04535 [Rhodobacteraceae bacterium]|nr:hypothetical protein [Paracoccaceae bacterium]
MTVKLFAGICLYILGHVLAWFQLNSQFVWDWAKTTPMLSVLVYSIPVGICFLYGTKFCVEETGALWSSRFLAFAASYMAFPVMTWYFLNESMFTTKTMICIALSICIVMIQIFWK